MARRAAVLLLAVLALALAAPAAAPAQSDPFGELPSGGQPTPTPAPVQTDVAGEDDVGRTTLYVIMGGLLVAFMVGGLWISRDARRRVPARHQARPDQLRDEGPHRHPRQAKAKSRSKGRQAKAARRKNR